MGSNPNRRLLRCRDWAYSSPHCPQAQILYNRLGTPLLPRWACRPWKDGRQVLQLFPKVGAANRFSVTAGWWIPARNVPAASKVFSAPVSLASLEDGW